MTAQPSPSPFQLQQLQIRLASAVVETLPEIEPERARALARVWAEQVRRGQQARDDDRASA